MFEHKRDCTLQAQPAEASAMAPRVWPQIEADISWCEGRVMHSRSSVASHSFVYPIAFMRIPLRRLQQGRRWGGLFGINCAAVFSFQQRDHGARDGSPLLPWLEQQLARLGVDEFALGEVVLQTFPRLFGYVFNPVSFWFCHDTSGQLRAVLCEVNNTFGEAHNYLVYHPELRPIAPGDQLTTAKVFHVSPFFPVSGDYYFSFVARRGHVAVHIDYRQRERSVLLAYIGGRVSKLKATALLSALIRFPFMTLGVMARIHFHALLLWRKGARFHRKPSPPLENLT